MRRLIVVGAAAAAGVVAGRRATHRWGATRAEHAAALPGDQLVADPAIVATRAVTVDAPPEEVWAWLVQIGQDRGGMYSYDWLENLVGLDIHSAAEIRDEWQHLGVGDRVVLVPEGVAGGPGYSLPVAAVEPPRTLVLRQSPPEHPWDAVWSFHLQPVGEGRTRLVSRSRSHRHPGVRGIADIALDTVMDPVTWIMTRKMLLGIRRRSEGRVVTAPAGSGTPSRPGLDLYWIPLGAGRDVVRISGTIYEALCALVQRRPRSPLFHSALVATTPAGRFVIEMTDIRDGDGAERGVVAEGAVGTRWLGRFRLFRYEIRRWQEGVIPDISYAVQSPVRITDDAGITRELLELVPQVPTDVWGRDAIEAGDMWNSNSVTSWLLASCGVEAAAGRPPSGGRAPGWTAGLVAARSAPSKAAPAAA
jgi:uncharacterized protein YndB with AHSA1/START domain